LHSVRLRARVSARRYRVALHSPRAGDVMRAFARDYPGPAPRTLYRAPYTIYHLHPVPRTPYPVGLSLEITQATDSLTEMLEAFTCPERLDKDNKLKCSGCKQMTRASKQLSLYRAPNILCVHLKRFRPGFQGKVNKPIKFDEQLSLKHFMTAGSPDIDPQYELLAVLVHLDVRNISSFGHYVAFVLGGDGKWFVCDDAQVEEVPKEIVLQQNAYMLFYQRKGDPRLFTTALECEGETLDELPAAVQTTANAPAAEAKLCIAGCGFFGQAARRGMCTQCFSKESPAEAKALEARERLEAEQRAREHKRAEIVARVEKAKKDAVKKVAAQVEKAKAATEVKPAQPTATIKAAPKGKPNDPCPCGSGKKYKKCHMSAF